MNYIKIFIIFFVVFYLKVTVDSSRDWWKYTTIYEIYIWSFKDSNGDGIGDIKGITSMLDHFVDLKIETLWISPFYKSPMHDLGYDVENFKEVDPQFGTMEDFDELAKEIKKRGLKLVIDFVLNHSSDEHPWFKKSVDKIEPYTNFYVWRDAKKVDNSTDPVPPNNWVSLFGGSAWTWNEKRKQFYFHQFSEKQPDFNLRDSFLKTELKSIFRFWLNKGVSGVRLDATKHFMEDLQLRDEPLLHPEKPPKEPKYVDFNHIYTTNLVETYQFIHELRKYVDSNYHSKKDQRILIAEAYTDINNTMLYYGNSSYKVSHYPFNVLFVGLSMYPSPKHYDDLIKSWLNNMPPGSVANWMAENHDNYRIGTRLNEEFADITLITIMMLPGVACIYYGQEIGMLDNDVRPDQIRDPNNNGDREASRRDRERLPMQWDDTMNAGFTSRKKPWLPVNTNYWRINVQSQKEEKENQYHLFRTLSKLRQTKTLKFGQFKSYLVAKWIYAFSRFMNGEPMYTVVFNLGTETALVHLHHTIPKLPSQMKVLAASINAGYVPGNDIETHPQFPRSFIMRPLSAVVLTKK